MEKKNTQETQPIKYYGKKAYRIHPLLARVKLSDTSKPDYQNHEIDKSQKD